MKVNKLNSPRISRIKKSFLCYLEPLEFFAFSRIFFSFADDEQKIVCENEWNSLSIDAKLLLHVTQKVAKVDVEDLTV